MLIQPVYSFSNKNIFTVTMLVKLIDGFLGMAGGIIVYYVSVEQAQKVLSLLFRHELIEDPADLLFSQTWNFLEHLSFSTQSFIALYLFVNGVIKAFLITAILQKKMWAYPVTASVFVVMVLYEMYRIAFTHSLVLAIIILVDVAITYLILREYKSLLKVRALDES